MQNLKCHIENDELQDFPSPSEVLEELVIYRAFMTASKQFKEETQKVSEKLWLVMALFILFYILSLGGKPHKIVFVQVRNFFIFLGIKNSKLFFILKCI